MDDRSLLPVEVVLLAVLVAAAAAGTGVADVAVMAAAVLAAVLTAVLPLLLLSRSRSNGYYDERRVSIVHAFVCLFRDGWAMGAGGERRGGAGGR